ncbi:MAG: nuclear transport factor 2 family protein [Myxococcales bacterium]|nr:nuclear transport factor 2 family protein [Myxococcales bacterium]
MATFSLEEVERAFQRFWRTGMVREDWDGWVDLFVEDVVYEERVLGTMHGREAVRRWIVPLMQTYGEIYGVYDWHHADPSGRVVFRMLNRRDHPSGTGHLDFPGITVLQYAGDMRWSREEDYWAEKLAIEQFHAYEVALKAHDPTHRDQRTRRDWGDGPAWTRP